MKQEELNKILAEHRLWLETDGEEGKRANLTRANLTRANLKGANLAWADLTDANLDFSAFPLWCGGLDVHMDDGQAIQLLYHLVRNVQFSKNTSKELKELLGTEVIVNKANEFHRVNECGKIARCESDD